MPIELVHIGFDNFLAVSRIIAIASPTSTNIKRAIKEANGQGNLIDMTHGRKTRAAIFTDDGHIFLTSRAPEIIAGRLSVSHVGAIMKPEQDDQDDDELE